MILLIDNYDSFTYNLYQYFLMLGEEVVVVRNDALTLRDVEEIQPSLLVLSPGPGNPDKAGLSLSLVHHSIGRWPLLGICLGMQTIAQAFGGRIVCGKEPVHGKTSLLQHHQRGLFAGLPVPLLVTRYHSLVVEGSSLPDCLEVTAQTEDGVVMALRHRKYPIAGVQFHPEAVLTECGFELLKNSLTLGGLS